MAEEVPGMKRFLYIFIFLSLIILSCEKDDQSDIEVAEALEGEWSVDETSQYYKNQMSTYQVEITPVSENDDQVLISNFYQLGYENSVMGDIEGKKIKLVPNQEIIVSGISSYTILSGTGNISDDYQNIDWNYEVDDGSGQIDYVEAIYTKI